VPIDCDAKTHGFAIWAGGQNNPPVPAGKNAMEYWFDQHKVYIALGYCGSRGVLAPPSSAPRD
jgi:hypothetical protein